MIKIRILSGRNNGTTRSCGVVFTLGLGNTLPEIDADIPAAD
jgi:hypothetical protein